MIKPCPCNGCDERFIACSDRCPKDLRGEYGHKAWKEQYHAEQKHLERNKQRWQTPWSPAMEKTTRSNLKFGAGGHKYGGGQ